MSDQFTFTFEASPDPDDVQIIRDGLTAYNLQFVSDAQYQPLNIIIRDANDRVIGGLVGNTYWGWLYISLFWVAEHVRQSGNGSKMLAMAEEEAFRRGCRHVHLDTLDFQAPGFYEKHDYVSWGILDDLPIGHKRIFYRKELRDSND